MKAKELAKILNQYCMDGHADLDVIIDFYHHIQNVMEIYDGSGISINIYESSEDE